MFLIRNISWSSKIFKTSLSRIGNSYIQWRSNFDLKDVLSPGRLKGHNHLASRRLNKGFAFSFEERLALGIHGLMPACFRTQEEQLQVIRIFYDLLHVDLNKFLYLADLQDRNDRLFFRFIGENLDEILPIIYTPTVGLACQEYGLVNRKLRGLFISIHDKGNVYKILTHWPEATVRAICISDGENVMGLGDLGSNGMAVPIGKLSLYTALGHLRPHQVLPIQIDVGTNNKAFLNDPFYNGLKHKRVASSELEELMDELMLGIVKRFGQDTLVDLVNFSLENGQRFLAKYRDKYCIFSDEIQVTAAMVLAGLFSSERVTRRKFTENRILIVGAGQKALNISNLLLKAFLNQGISKTEALDNIWMFDDCGLLTENRQDVMSNPEKKHYAKKYEDVNNLVQLIDETKPNVLIGTTGVKGLFNENILNTMATCHERPLIFCLKAPCECSGQQAFCLTEGRALFAASMLCPSIECQGNTYRVAEINNCFIFPGVAFAAIATSADYIKDDLFLIAAKQVAAAVTDEDLNAGAMYPLKSKIPEISLNISIECAYWLYENDRATFYPKPENIPEWLTSQCYNYYYSTNLPMSWKWKKPSKSPKLKKFTKYTSYTDTTAPP